MYSPLRIGLLGGSFNPAHAGHVHLSLQALKRLELDEIWWLVSPQNPLKSPDDMADYTLRVKSARAMAAAHPRVKVKEIEAEQGLRYTVDTLQFLKKRYPRIRFHWLMGADNLRQFHRWKGWREIFRLAPVAVFDRAPAAHPALRSKAALTFACFRRNPRNLRNAPGWCYVFMPRHAESATRLRNTLGKAAFLRHNDP